MEAEAKRLIILMLKESDLLTQHVRNKLHYDHNIDIRTYKVRSLLRELERKGIVSVITFSVTNKIGWKIVKH